MLEREAGNVSRALELAQRSLRECETARAHIVVGWGLCASGKLDEAIAQCNKAIELEPEWGDGYNELAQCLLERGDYDGALPYLEKAVKAKYSDTFHHAHFNLARVFMSRGMLLRAAEAFRESLRIDPGFQPSVEGLIRCTESIN